jgi:hypothetical protein
MILNPNNPEVVHSSEPIRRIDMSQMDAESIQVMLENSRDGFYSNKILAPIREYSTNASDAHIEAGISDRPIEITLPTVMEPELKIRDFGKGLSIDQLTDIYFKYWKSTKRNTNELNGALGIGCKSFFAYSDAFTVVSICDGYKTIVTGQRNGFADVIYHQPTDEPSGIEIISPIQAKDIQRFVDEALNFFQYWEVKPVLKNIDEETVKAAFSMMETKPFLYGVGWAVRPAGYGAGKTVAIMANVAYTIDWEQVKSSISTELFNKINGIFTFLQENLTTLTFANGSLSFTPNRESLQYNDITVTELGKKLTAIYDSLLTLISSKISDAPNLWEAKIRYNMIFRKELDGFDKAFVYGGNLQTIERLLTNRIQWNGITITNGMFEGLGDWCAVEGKVGSYKDDSFTPVLTTYVKNDNKTGVVAVKTTSRRRRRYGYGSSAESKIICSPKSVVVIQDTEKAALAKGFARWILYKSGMDVSQVYVLDLHNADVKDEFYKHFNFETVPVKFVSANELVVKTYLKSIRAPRGTRVAGESASRPLNCPFMEIKNRRNGRYVSGTYWRTEGVNARNLATGGYYVVYSKNGFIYNGREISHSNSEYFWQAIYDLALLAGEDLPKVYGIHFKVAESVWFKEAVEDGDWTNLSEFIKANEDCLPLDTLKKMSAYVEADENRIGPVVAERLSLTLIDNNGLAAKYFAEIAEFGKHWNSRNIVSWLEIAGTKEDEKEVERFRNTHKAMFQKYPLLFKTNSSAIFFNIEPHVIIGKTDAETLKALANYINLVDCYS